jgi:wyosine [tRNA(Phe)-imidazoG37] synthetase (radical SAM superfamily)
MGTLQDAFASHPRRWRDFQYVYPVIARRSRGLSLGINLNPDGICGFDCVYCCVDRLRLPRGAKVDLAVLEAELRHLAANYANLFAEPEFQEIPDTYRRLKDFAFSGDGEPTASPAFPDAVRVAATVRREFSLSEVKVVLITNACYLTRPAVADTLRILDDNNGEIWAKLDAGTAEYFQQVDRSSFTLEHVVGNILVTARVRPVVIQSMFLRLAGAPPAQTEIAAYVERLRQLRVDGAQLALVQVYTLARPALVPYVTPLTSAELEAIAATVRGTGIPAEVFP